MFYKLAYLICYIYYRIFHRIEILGTEHIPKGGAIIASNHASNYDPIVVSGTTGMHEPLHFVARSTLFTHRFFSWMIRKLNAHPITRGGSMASVIKLLKQLTESGKKVLFFPEGARTFNGKVQPILGGIGVIASQVQCPIVPVYVKGTFEVWSRFKPFPRPWGKITIEVGSPISWDDYAHLPKKEAQIAITEALQKALYKLEAKHS